MACPASVTVSGGEKPLHPQWVRSVRDQCEAAGVNFRFESWGDFVSYRFVPREYWFSNPSVITATGKHLTGKNVLDDLNEINAEIVAFVGRERSGRTLDGREWRGEEEG